MGNFTLKGSRLFKGKPIKKRLAEKLREYNETLAKVIDHSISIEEPKPKKTKKLTK